MQEGCAVAFESGGRAREDAAKRRCQKGRWATRRDAARNAGGETRDAPKGAMRHDE
jgi:hypothetical protein